MQACSFCNSICHSLLKEEYYTALYLSLVAIIIFSLLLMLLLLLFDISCIDVHTVAKKIIIITTSLVYH